MKVQAPSQSFQKDYPYTDLVKAAQTTQEMVDALLNPLLYQHPYVVRHNVYMFPVICQVLQLQED